MLIRRLCLVMFCSSLAFAEHGGWFFDEPEQEVQESKPVLTAREAKWLKVIEKNKI